MIMEKLLLRLEYIMYQKIILGSVKKLMNILIFHS